MKLTCFYLKSLILFFFLFLTCLNALKGQDYHITFSGTGESTSVGSVKIENLTQGTSLDMDGSDVLHLVSIITGIEADDSKAGPDLILSPNPMKEFSIMKYRQNEPGRSIIMIHDLAGRKVVESEANLLQGEHNFRLSGIDKGTYIITVISGKKNYSARLMSLSRSGGHASIAYEQMSAVQEKPLKGEGAKGTRATVQMQYNEGDQLKATGTSGMCATFGMMVPTGDMNYTFTFVTCKDGDNNNYPVIKIGSQIWMAENLKTTKYNDGTDIPNITDNTLWKDATGAGYCWYNNDVSNKNLYGGLYNWMAVNSGKVCPTGWHAASLDEWQTLSDNTGGSSNSGGALKERGYNFWNSPNEGATNSSGFSAHGGGFRDCLNGSFKVLKVDGYWWSSTDRDAETAKGTYIHYYNAIIWDNYTDNKKQGFSVRCIK